MTDASEHGSSPALRAQAVEDLAHAVASLVHGAMASKRVSVASLKRKLTALGHRSTDFVDDILAARKSHDIELSHLSDTLFVLEVCIDLKLVPMLDEPRGLSAIEAPGAEDVNT